CAPAEQFSGPVRTTVRPSALTVAVGWKAETLVVTHRPRVSWQFARQALIVVLVVQLRTAWQQMLTQSLQAVANAAPQATPNTIAPMNVSRILFALIVTLSFLIVSFESHPRLCGTACSCTRMGTRMVPPLKQRHVLGSCLKELTLPK